MAAFSTNQVRHFYVVNDTPVDSKDSLATAGQITTATKDATGESFYFTYQGPETIIRTDAIPVKNIIDVRAARATTQRTKRVAKLLTLADIGADTDIITGQDYILRVEIQQAFGNSDEDYYFKNAAVHGFSDMTASQFYVLMAVSLAKNFSREVSTFVNIYLTVGDAETDPDVTNVVEVSGSPKPSDFTDTYNGILIEEAEQPWTRGMYEKLPVKFNVVPTTITYDGEERIWGVVADATADRGLYTINGYKIADMEYFYMGERGDQYRMIGFPNVIFTKYLVNPTYEYDTLDIHYYFEGSGMNSNRSQKTLTIVAQVDPDEGGSALDDILSSIATITGETYTIIGDSNGVSEDETA